MTVLPFETWASRHAREPGVPTNIVRRLRLEDIDASTPEELIERIRRFTVKHEGWRVAVVKDGEVPFLATARLEATRPETEEESSARLASLRERYAAYVARKRRD